jgi:predicted TIM-barrel fold metal-dependent hydrolase
MTEKIRAIDAWAAWNPPDQAPNWPDSFKHIFRRYGTLDLLEKGYTLEEFLEAMDASHVEICVITAFEFGAVKITNERVAEACRKYPQRLRGSGTVDPRDKPMKVLREIEHMVRDLGFVALRLEPYAYGDGITGLPPNDKRYWPIYAKCCELNIPICIQVGHTGPLLPSEPGRPIYLDEVALAFPELTIIGCHLGQPWHEEMMILAWKHPNVYVETSARSPKHWPPSFVEFVKTWGQDKVIWGTDYPLLTFRRCLDEIDALQIPLEAKHKLLSENARRAFKLKTS